MYKRNGDNWDFDATLQPAWYDDTTGGYRFGYSVAINNAGDTIVVGAPFDGHVPGAPSYYVLGASYVFTRTDSTWEEAHTISIPPQTEDPYEGAFGNTVGIADDGTITIGAPQVQGIVIPDQYSGSQGAIYVYDYDGTAPVLSKEITLPLRRADDFFAWGNFGMSSNGQVISSGQVESSWGYRSYIWKK